MELEGRPPSLATENPSSLGSRFRFAALDGVTDRVAFAALVLILLFIYGLLQNPYWVPAGDSELYTAVARNLAIGQGYTFNGQPVAITPPGWTWMMAAVMKITPYFLPLKLLAMACMIGSLAIDYWIIRRFVSPAKAVGIILLTAIISHVYQATYWLVSEGSFCLMTSASVLLAMQIAEGKKHPWWRVGLLLFFCAAAISIRFAGMLGVLLVIAALIRGQWKPRPTTPWIAAVLIIVVSLATFVTLRHALGGTPEQTAAASDMVTGTTEDQGTMPVPDTGAPISGSANQSAKAYHLFPTGSYADRFLNFGRWFSYLYWQPFRAAGASVLLLATATMVGWVVIAVLAVLVVQSARRKQWLWLALGLYTGALAIGWTNVNARYYVPVTFLITLGMFLATDELIAIAATLRVARIAVLTAFIAFVGGVAFCNGALYAVEMSIARSDRFYARYEDGLNMGLINACQYLNSLPDPPRDGQIAVSQRYTNLNKAKASPFGLRASALLLNKVLLTPRFKDTTSPPNKSDVRAGRDIRRWLNSKGVKYYLYQPEISPWRVWHFRMGSYEKMQTGHTAEKDTAGWQLYVYTPGAEDDWVPIRVPNKFRPVTRVPGL
jgi:hypothetical protein